MSMATIQPPPSLARRRGLARGGRSLYGAPLGILVLEARFPRIPGDIAAHVGVPVATSSLMQVPWVQATLPPGKRVGLVTVCSSTLTPAHLAAAGVPADVPVAGTENGREFFRVLIRAEKDNLDVDGAERDILDAGRGLVSRHPE